MLLGVLALAYWQSKNPLLAWHQFELITVSRPTLPSTAIAAGIIGENRWDADPALLRKGNPDNWRKLIDDTPLVTTNRGRIDSCRAAAVKSKKGENCMITVPAGK